MRDDAVLRRALPLGQGLGRSQLVPWRVTCIVEFQSKHKCKNKMFDNLSVENIKQKIRDGESIRISFQSWRRLLAYLAFLQITINLGYLRLSNSVA